MRLKELSTCFCTEKIEECKAFYVKHLGAKLEFDCGWYISLVFGENGPTLQFMTPQDGQSIYQKNGVTLNIKVDDVDSEYKKLSGLGLTEKMPLEDHPWGDRGFAVYDPIGITLYIYSDREPSKEFKQYYKD